MTKREVNKCVIELLDALCDRAGFDDWWYSLDNDVESEIEAELRSIIMKRVNTKEK